MLIPPGFADSVAPLEAHSEVQYKVSSNTVPTRRAKYAGSTIR
jgi:hypothetical protein